VDGGKKNFFVYPQFSYATIIGNFMFYESVPYRSPGRYLMTKHRIILVLLLFALMAAAARPASAASASSVEIASITIAPESPAGGQQPGITARIVRKAAAAPQEPEAFAIIAAVTMPDNRTMSWMWKNVTLRTGGAREFTLPKMFDTKLIGRYKIEYNVYSADMRRRFASRTAGFSAGPAAQPAVPAAAAAGKEAPRRPQAELHAFGLGVSANAFNPAGGGTVMLWPFRNVGLQGTYTVGTFTSYEARLLVRFERPSGFNPYIAAGYLSVSLDKDVIGVSTTFKDSNVSGAVGVEVPLGRRVRGYVEVSGTSITLEEIVTNGAQTAKSTVAYAPVTINAGIVFYLF